MSNYVSGVIEDEEHILNVDRLVIMVSHLKWKYYELYHLEPGFIKIPLWVYVLLEQFSHQLIGYNSPDECRHVSTYMGLKVCPTVSIDKLEDIEVF